MSTGSIDMGSPKAQWTCWDCLGLFFVGSLLVEVLPLWPKQNRIFSDHLFILYLTVLVHVLKTTF